MTAVIKANFDYDNDAVIFPNSANSNYPNLEYGDAIPEDIAELAPILP